ncbi:MAG: DsbA family protein [Flavisolibacter sp.]|nr:DsbA family protein [Flavisolibacter sp.]
MQPTLYYCYDALCGWCYGFSPVIKRLAEEYKDQVVFDVLSGGMIMHDNTQPVSAMAGYISKAYKNVEERTGIRFGDDYLWHIFNPDKSDWFLNSEKPAVVLCIFKEYHPDKAVQIAGDLQYAHLYEGRDLTDDEAYRHLLSKYNIPEEDFYTKLHSEEYLDKAYYEFALVKQLQVSGFPTVLLQVTDSKFYLLTRGYADYETMKQRIDKVLQEIQV